MELLAAALAVVGQLPDADALSARGAALRRDEIVAFARECLDVLSGSEDCRDP